MHRQAGSSQCRRQLLLKTLQRARSACCHAPPSHRLVLAQAAPTTGCAMASAPQPSLCDRQWAKTLPSDANSAGVPRTTLPGVPAGLTPSFRPLSSSPAPDGNSRWESRPHVHRLAQRTSLGRWQQRADKPKALAGKDPVHCLLGPGGQRIRLHFTIVLCHPYQTVSSI